MVRFWTGIWILIHLNFIGCSGLQRSSASIELMPLQPVTINPKLKEPPPTAPFTVKHLYTKEDVLYVDVSYHGGCEDHSFELISNQQYTNYYPTELALFMVHNDRGDLCRSLVYKTLQFDVHALQHEATREVRLIIRDQLPSTKYTY